MQVNSRTAKKLVEGPATGQTYRLVWLEAAANEGRNILDSDQYAHLVGLFDELANEPDPRFPKGLDVRKIEDFYELRERGGIFRKINIRVYFKVYEDLRVIAVLRCDKKKTEGSPRIGILVTIRTRARVTEGHLRRQQNGDGK